MSKATYHPYMPKEQREWLKKLISKGVMIELLDCNGKVIDLEENEDLDFSSRLECYRIPTQPIPDIPDWRELCREMQDKGVVFEHEVYTNNWQKAKLEFTLFTQEYRISQQSLPEWREELNFDNEETEYPKWQPPAAETKGKLNKDTNKLETIYAGAMEALIKDIPHRELQIQWHKDKIHSLEIGEPMQEWEWSKNGIDWQSLGTIAPTWTRSFYYRRSPRIVNYWHCVIQIDETPEIFTEFDINEIQYRINRCKETYPLAKIGPISETIVELED